MGFFDPDVYNQPEKFGLRFIGEVSWDDAPYQFDLTVVLADEQGWLYWAHDSGCSCPMPFESFTDMEDLTKGTFYELAEELTKRLKEESPAAFDVTQLLGNIKMRSGLRA